MRNKLHSRLVRWALGKHLLITVMAVSRWLWSAVTFPPGGARGNRVLWRAMAMQGAWQQRGLQPMRRTADARRVLSRYERLLRLRVLDNAPHAA